jgi:Flp pilus assembly protein TadG
MSKRRNQRGAAAVEFALVLPLFVTLVFGIIDYGFYFNDSVSTRNGVREAARQGVVSNFSNCGGSGTSLDKLRCQTKQNVGTLTGVATAKVYVPGGTWTKGAPLVVCAKVTGSGVVGFVPTPSSTRSRVEMSIENEGTAPTGALSSADSGDWSWC